MSFPRELLELAEQATVAKSPTSAALRRSVSSAYYAVFHLLTTAATDLLVGPGASSETRTRVARSFQHTAMATVARTVQAPTDLKTVAEAFTTLQRLRHSADYDLETPVTLVSATEALQYAQEAFDAWERVSQDPAAQSLLVHLAFPQRR
jgi:uncharacterized protein (UPF0332 family)